MNNTDQRENIGKWEEKRRLVYCDRRRSMILRSWGWWRSDGMSLKLSNLLHGRITRSWCDSKYRSVARTRDIQRYLAMNQVGRIHWDKGKGKDADKRTQPGCRCSNHGSAVKRGDNEKTQPRKRKSIPREKRERRRGRERESVNNWEWVRER